MPVAYPAGVRPVVHWSESQEGRKPHAHSDFVEGPLRLYGLDDQVDAHPTHCSTFTGSAAGRGV